FQRPLMPTKAQQLLDLHAGPRALLIANVWDPGSARLMAGLGFAALASSSGAAAGLFGGQGGEVTREEALTQAQSIVSSVDIPVSADLEKGWGDRPEDAAETIRRAAAAGLAGGSIEDFSGDPARPIYDLGLAVERIAASVEAARTVPG